MVLGALKSIMLDLDLLTHLWPHSMHSHALWLCPV